MNKGTNIKLENRLKDILEVGKELEKLKLKEISEIKVIISPVVKDGNPVLLVSEKDFELFKKIK